MTMLNKNLQILAALVSFSSLAFADGYESPNDVMYVSFPAEASEPANDVLSCTQARSTAWFERELARTDGGPAPDVEYEACRPEILAHSSADSD
jgi:hypothetical protein